MAKLDKAKEELKNHLKELNVKNGKWEAPDGDIYYVCHQGKFYRDVPRKIPCFSMVI